MLLHVVAADPSATVREAAGWALGHGHGAEPAARRALETAAIREPDRSTREALRRHRERAS